MLAKNCGKSKTDQTIDIFRPKINQNLGKIHQLGLGKSIDVVNERFKKVQSNSPVKVGKII